MELIANSLMEERYLFFLAGVLTMYLVSHMCIKNKDECLTLRHLFFIISGTLTILTAIARKFNWPI